MLSMSETDTQWFRDYVTRVRWKEAKSYAGTTPHSYTVKEWNTEWQDFIKAVYLIRTYGKPENFFKKVYIYLYLDEHKYWTMGSPIEETIVINRAEPDIFYGRRIFFPDNPIYEETVYDRLAPKYDKRYSTPECIEENKTLFRLLRNHLTGHILDIGCGTGITLDYVQIPHTHYLGIDPSQGMRNEFIRKHPYHEFIQDTLENAEIIGTFTTAISLFGSPSYINPAYYEKILALAPNYYLMFYSEGYKPDYQTDDAILVDREAAKLIFGEPTTFNNFDVYTNLEFT